MCRFLFIPWAGRERLILEDYAISEFPRASVSNEVKCLAFDMEMIFHSPMHIKLIFTRKVVMTWPHFESEGFWNSD